jgi:hypothetical protein
VLLSRDTLAKITLEAEADAPRPVSEPGMPRVAQDRVILSTLASAERMNSAIVWNKIRTIADDDPSLSVRKAAIELMARHNAPAEAGVRDGSSD